MIRRLIFLFCLGVASCHSAYSATWTLYYPRPDDEEDKRTTYPLAVLKLALKHTGVNYNLYPSHKVLNQGRAIKQLKANREISLVWSMTDKLREEELLPVRIPIYKGLIGWRLFLVTEENYDVFSSFTSIQELRQYTPVQGHDWPDTKILQANGFEVVTSNKYDEMFDIVRLERAGFFPRSIVEVWAEMANPVKNQGLRIEPHLAIRYPTATYFFFNKKNIVMKNLIETGLRRAIASGDFDQLFFREHQEYIDQANIKNRIVFELENPVLPEETPVDEPQYWYSVEDAKQTRH